MIRGRAAGLIYATCGVHPCSAKKFEKHPGGPDAYMRELEALAREGIADGTVVAFGEFGLDCTCPQPSFPTCFHTPHSTHQN